MESPATRTKNVAVGFWIKSSLRSSGFSTKSSPGAGKPAAGCDAKRGACNFFSWRVGEMSLIFEGGCFMVFVVYAAYRQKKSRTGGPSGAAFQILKEWWRRWSKVN